MKLTYWVAPRLNDSDAYSVRATTKKEAQQLLDAHDCPEDYGPLKKVTVEYSNGFDLLKQCLSESGNYWEYSNS